MYYIGSEAKTSERLGGTTEEASEVVAEAGSNGNYSPM